MDNIFPSDALKIFMNRTFFNFNVDLVSIGNFSSVPIEEKRKEILSLGGDSEISRVFSDLTQKTKGGKIEIYGEDVEVYVSRGKEFLNFNEEVFEFVKLVESKIGGFIPGSSIEVGKDPLFLPERWVKGKYSWDPEETPDEEDLWEGDVYWEDGWEE